MTQCENCIHKKICDLWEEIDGADAGCYSLSDTCYYFAAATHFTEDAEIRIKEFAGNDLIRRSQAYEAMTKQQQLTPSVVRRVLLQVPTVDAVEVVRCKDCFGRTCWEKDNNGCDICWVSGMYVKGEMISAHTANGKKVLTMAEYIEREELLRKIRWASSEEEAVISVRRMPASDVAQVKHGHWIPIGRRWDGYVYECSECTAKYDGISNFCPNCGAKMDRGAYNV